MAKATDQPTSTTTPTQTMSPDGLTELARRLRDHADAIRNPAAAKAMGDDMRAAADVIDGLLQLYAHVRAGEEASVVQGVLKLIGGRS